MGQLARIEATGGIATITLDGSPGNALGVQLRRALQTSLAAALADPAVRVIILEASGKSWPSSGDIRELEGGFADPSPAELVGMIAASPKPVIAVLHGSVVGVGLELALAAAVRIATQGTRFGFPEVTLGILPCAGGTQRLPRLVGAQPALGMLLGGQLITAARAEEIGLVDATADTGAQDVARSLAMSHLSGAAELPTAAERAATTETDAGVWLEAVAGARITAQQSRLPAPERIVDCVEAALLLPGDEGIAFEETAFEDLVTSPEARALRHLFLAERRATQHPGPESGTAQVLYRASILGTLPGTPELARRLAHAGLSVTLIEPDEDARAAAMAQFAALGDAAAKAGKLTEAEQVAEWERLSGAGDTASVATADLVVVPARVAAAAAGLVLRPGALLLVVRLPGDPTPLHPPATGGRTAITFDFLHSGAGSARFVEIGASAGITRDQAATALVLARRLGLMSVPSRGGEIGARLTAALRTVAQLLVEDGASPYQVDETLRDYGFARGPFQEIDAEGLDVAAARAALPALLVPGARRPVLLEVFRAEGRFGQVAGQGFYRYPRDGKAAEDLAALGLVAEMRSVSGITARKVGARDIRQRVLAALANEGARLLSEGVARSPAEVDLVAVAGLGFPRHRGGPMHAADGAGLLQMRTALRAFAREDAALWTPGPIWDELIKNGRAFTRDERG